MKWKSSMNSLIPAEHYSGKKQTQSINQIQRINSNSHNSYQNQNQKLNLASIPKPNWLISTVFCALAFTLIPLFPIVIAFLVGHWISNNNKK